jgi:hypothetical protein
MEITEWWQAMIFVVAIASPFIFLTVYWGRKDDGKKNH